MQSLKPDQRAVNNHEVSGPRVVARESGSTGTKTERLDKWLWMVRIFKTRSLATDACRAGSIEINGQAVKPARDVRVGEVVKVRQGLITRTLRVLDAPGSRLGAKLVAGYYEDQTPPEEFEKAREHRMQHYLAREKGSGRPTKRERRTMDELFG